MSGTFSLASQGPTLVTGAAGFVGRRLFQALQADGEDVWAWHRRDGDLRDEAAVRHQLERLRPKRIYHLASKSPGSGDDFWSRIADEQGMIANLAYAMPSHCQLIYTGSMAEYGRSGTLHELDRCIPDTGYGCAKFSGTTLCVALRSLLDRDIRAVRLFGIYGPGEAANRLLPYLIDQLGKGAPVSLSDGTQLRDFVHIDDACRALRHLADMPNETTPSLCNIGTGVGVTVRTVCERVADILGADRHLLRFGDIPRRPVDQDILVADTGRLMHITHSLPQRWLDNALSEQFVAALISHAKSGPWL